MTIFIYIFYIKAYNKPHYEGESIMKTTVIYAFGTAVSLNENDQENRRNSFHRALSSHLLLSVTLSRELY